MHAKVASMNMKSAAVPRIRRTPLTTLGKLTLTALLINALVYGVIAVAQGPRPIFLAHSVIPLLVAVLVALGFRWAPGICALLSGFVLPYEWSAILSPKLTHPDNMISFIFAATLVATLVVGLVVGIGATVQKYRAAGGRTPVD
ncbi:MAG: hypothetical protein NVS2B16_37090 [Chloroflexota bacterium]